MRDFGALASFDPIARTISILTTILLVLGINVAQFLFGLGFDLDNSNRFIQYGIPFTVYEDVIFANRGYVVYLGIIGNFIFAIFSGFVLSKSISSLRSLLNSSQ